MNPVHSSFDILTGEQKDIAPTKLSEGKKKLKLSNEE
jgi:hypothetical protein